MMLNNELEKIEYTTKQMLGYLLVAFDNVKKCKKRDLSVYIGEIIKLLKIVDKKDILKTIDIRLIANFPVCYLVNSNELMAFALVVFVRLLKSNKEVTKRDIIRELEVQMMFFSTRTILRECKRVLKNIEIKL